MNDEHAMVTRSSCNDCVHNLVCSYKKDFHDVCNAVAGADVHKHMDNGRVKITNVLAYKDILDEIVIKCKHFYDGAKIRINSDSIVFQPYPQPGIRDYSTVSVASDTPNSVTTISNATKAKIDPPSNLETTTDYAFR